MQPAGRRAPTSGSLAILPAPRAPKRGPHDPDDARSTSGRARSTRPGCGSTGRTTWRRTRYQMSEKFEYFAIRNARRPVRLVAALQVPDPRAGRGALPGRRPARDIRTLRAGPRPVHGLVRRPRLRRRGRRRSSGSTADEFLLTCAEPNLAYFEGLVGRLDVAIEDVADDWAVLADPGPAVARHPRRADARSSTDLPYFGVASTTIGKVPRPRLADRLHRRPRLRAVGPGRPMRSRSGTRSGARSRGRGVIPFGMIALYMARIEAGLVLLDVDFHSSRFAWTDADRSTPIELGLGWMVRDIDDRRPRVHRPRRDRRELPARRRAGS